MPCPNCRCASCLALVGSTIPSAEFSLPSSELAMANRAPTNSEVAHSQDAIRSSQNMVSLMQAMIDDLENRKAELSGLIGKHKAAISPLRSFPPELLAEIFRQLVATMDGYWRSRDSLPLTLMGICSRWRRVVLDTPRLWTRILTAHPMIDSWITRSKELPLHVELYLSSSVSYRALEALIPHSHRWQYIDFCLEPNSNSVLGRVKTRLSSLECLSLSFGGTTGTVDFCEVAPRLTNAKLMHIYKPVTIKLPWEQLRICTLDRTEVVHYVLQHAKNLRELYLDMFDLSVTDAPTQRVMPQNLDPHSHHLKLNVLVIEWNSRDPEINPFLSSITLPSLQTLRIHFDYDDPDDPDNLADANASRIELEPILARFFERSCARLSVLKLIDIPFSQGGVIKCLTYSPSLVSLDIQFDARWHKINKNLLDGLNVNHSRHILPRLHSLSLWEPASTFIERPLDALITSRRHIDPKHDGVALLENLTLGCTFFLLESGPPRLYRFVSEGLNITYGKDWDITYNSTRANSPAPSEEQI